MTKPKLKITGEHISKDGKNRCIHYSDGVVVKEELELKDTPKRDIIRELKDLDKRIRGNNYCYGKWELLREHALNKELDRRENK